MEKIKNKQSPFKIKFSQYFNDQKNRKAFENDLKNRTANDLMKTIKEYKNGWEVLGTYFYFVLKILLWNCPNENF